MIHRRSSSPRLASVCRVARSWGLGLAWLAATACGGGDPPVAVTPLPDALNALSVSPATVALQSGATAALTPVPVTGGSGVTVAFAYTTSASDVVTVSGAGVLTAVAPGTATITVTGTGNGSGFATSTRLATAVVTVSAPPPALTAFTLTPDTVALLTGGNATLTPLPVTAGAGVSLTYAYASSASAVATVNSAGLLTAVAPGTATITVTATGTGSGFAATTLQATAAVLVSAPPAALTAVAITPDSLGLIAGASTTLTPVPVTAGASVSVAYTYATSASAIATVNGAGIVSAIAPGIATITVTATGSGIGFTTTERQASVTVTVTAPAPPALPALTALTVSPANLTLTITCRGTITAVATPAGAGIAIAYGFSSSSPAVATIDSTGAVTAVSGGTALITVTATGIGGGFEPTSLDTTVAVTVSSEPVVLGLGFDCAQFARIPAGSFQMGSDTGLGNEGPVRTVTITKPFLMQRTEVTQAQWRQVMQGTGLENPSRFSGCGDTCPVEQINWDDIQQFLARLNQQDSGKHYRLPTEAEWEYAARAGTTGEYGGNGNINDMGWWSDNSGNRTHPVAQKLANAFGLFDMHGNVWESVNDWYSTTYYSTGPNVDPPGPIDGAFRVARGGVFFGSEYLARSAYRILITPAWRVDANGFRLVRDP